MDMKLTKIEAKVCAFVFRNRNEGSEPEEEK